MKQFDFRKKLIFLSFLIVDFFASMKITALTVATPKIAGFFSLSEKFIPWLINAYLYSIFITLCICLLASRFIREKISGKNFFVAGLALFVVGSLVVFFSADIRTFFVGEIMQGIGAAMAFIGQMWTMAESYKQEISKPLAWTEIGFVLGIIAGPFIGGIFSGLYLGSWKLIFIINAVICLLAMLILVFFYEKQTLEKFELRSENKLEKSFYWAIFCEIIIGVVAVAGEFILSIYLQNFRNFSSLATGLILLSASLGVIFGSLKLAFSKEKDFDKKIKNGLKGMLLASIFMGLSFRLSIIYLIPPALFIVGGFYGYLGVAIFSYISQILSANVLVKGTILYLIAMQLGNALGIQTETFWNLAGHSFLLLIVFMVSLLIVGVFASLQLRNPEAEK